MIIHLGVNALSLVDRRARMRLPVWHFIHPVAIFGFICVLIVAAASVLMANALTSENNFDHLAFITTPCQETIIDDQTGLRVVLRIDDIQAHAWRDIQQRMIDDAISHGYAPVLAVIPVGLRDDTQMYEYLRRVRCDVEFALHGWDNKEPVPGRGEFSMLTESEARRRLKRGIAEITRLSREDVTTFVPPNNELSEGSRTALREVEIPIVSSWGNNLYDYDASTFDFKRDVFVLADQTFEQCRGAAAWQGGLCVIMLHPQDYTSDGAFDAGKYAEYLKLLSLLKEEKYGSTRFQSFDAALEN